MKGHVQMVEKYLRYKHLEEKGIVNNWTTLQRWIRDGHFPPGRMIGPNSRAWTESEVAEFQTRRNGSSAHLPTDTRMQLTGSEMGGGE